MKNVNIDLIARQTESYHLDIWRNTIFILPVFLYINLGSYLFIYTRWVHNVSNLIGWVKNMLIVLLRKDKTPLKKDAS